MSATATGRLHGKTAFISGAGRNIGRAIAIELGSRHCNLVINGQSNRADCDETARLALEAGAGKVLVAMGNVGDREHIRAIADEALATFGRVDIAVNTAGIRPHTPFLSMREEDWHEIMDVNLHAAFHICRAFLPGMVEANWGRIVNITGKTAMEGYGERVPVSRTARAMNGL